MGEKPGDNLTTPLCPNHHTDGQEAQHKKNEDEWWVGHHIDPFEIALKLAETSPCKKIRSST